MICNVSTYRFAPLDGLRELRCDLQSLGQRLGLKGTILLATEGINLCLSGNETGVEAMMTRLRRIQGLENLDTKRSYGARQPFRRMLVKIKREIIAFGVDAVVPHRYTSPRLAPETLKQWLDDGREVVLLDTRNDYEVDLGTFRGARRMGLRTFREFPEAVGRLESELKDRSVVTFCTGGIRCEKAAPYLETLGFREVYQLDGGILRYFEEVGGEHYQGECFVFDARTGVDSSLRETSTRGCFVCLAALSPEEQAMPTYQEGVSCPHCFVGPERKAQQRLAYHQAALDRLAQELPGSTPGEQRRPLRIPGRYDQATLQETLSGLFPQVKSQEWEQLFQEQRLLGPDGGAARPDQRVRSGQQYVRVELAHVEPEVSARVKLLYEDEALIVVAKPAPLPVHSCGRFHRNTLRGLLNLVWAPESPRPCHRLDANTSGVMVLARTHCTAKAVQPQFAQRAVEKRYLARVHGHLPQEEWWEIELPIAEIPGGAGLRHVAADGQACLTRGRVLQRFEDGTSLLELVPMTGRTHQLRVHLWALGYPVVGDPAYLPGRQLGSPLTLSPADPPMKLHCWGLRLTHPVTRRRVSFVHPPDWAGLERDDPFSESL